MKRILFLYILLLVSVVPVFSQTDSIKTSELTREQIINLSYDQLLAMPFEELVTLANKLGITIDELLKMKTTVASKSALTPRETPGIISIITDEEIKAMGARDLIDVLRTVPGLNFGYDNYGVIGIQMRGNWAHEGKVLLIIDGQEFNDLKYNTLQFGRHFDVNQIKKIEIIRGPGSAIYGGNAELGVINITTYSGEDLKKISIRGSYGQMTKRMGHEDLSLMAGTKIKDWDISLKSFIGKGNHSDQFFDFDTLYDLSKGGSGTQAINFNIGVKNKNLSVKAIYDNYASDAAYIDPGKSYIHPDYYKTIAGELKYDVPINNKLTLYPKVNIRNSIPYWEEGYYKNTSIFRYSGNITSRYEADKNINITAGVEYFTDYGKMTESDSTSVFDNGKKNVSYNTISLFMESIIKWDIFNLVVGGRFDSHNEFGSAFAPRLGLTTLWHRYHLKLLYSGAFRSPSIGNLVFVNTNVKPERTKVLELEAGIKLNSNMFLTANAFDIWIKDPIIWYDYGDDYGYRNENKSGTLGFELEFKMKYNWGFGTVNYAYNQVNENTVPDYEVPGRNNFIGAPMHKITASGGLYLNKYICFSPTFIYMGKSYAGPAFPDSVNFNPVNAKLLFNCFLNLNNYKLFDLLPVDFGIGVCDIFNQRYPIIQPYRGLIKPFPGPSREFVVHLAVHFPLIK